MNKSNRNINTTNELISLRRLLIRLIIIRLKEWLTERQNWPDIYKLIVNDNLYKKYISNRYIDT